MAHKCHNQTSEANRLFASKVWCSNVFPPLLPFVSNHPSPVPGPTDAPLLTSLSITSTADLIQKGL